MAGSHFWVGRKRSVRCVGVFVATLAIAALALAATTRPASAQSGLLGGPDGSHVTYSHDGDWIVWGVQGGVVHLDFDAGPTVSIYLAQAELYLGANQHLATLNVGEGSKVVFHGADVVVLKDLVMTGVGSGATAATPEPATLSLLALGGLVLLRRRRMPRG
jgi:hypothetical protein